MLRRPLLVLLGSILWCGATGCEVRLREKQPAAVPVTSEVAAVQTGCAPLYTPTPEDDALLDDLQHRIFDFFWTEVYPETGIAIDHTENRTGKVAATGFELAAICIGVQRGWITYDQGYERTLKILNFFYEDPADTNRPHAEGHFGLWWHFVDGVTGKMVPVDCVAMCDSADFVAGAVVAGEFFKGTEVEELAKKIYDAVQWDKFVSRRADGGPGLLSFGWVPLHVSKSYYDTDGLLTFNMSGFVDNSLLIYVLALGSETHPIPQETWEQYVDSYTMGEYAGYECLMVGQLFCRQVPAAFVPFLRKRDRKIDYFQDTVYALLADRAFNRKENGYPPQLWGLTDVFGKDSYSHSAPPGPVMNDGTIGTTAFAGALPHVPGLALEAIKYVREKFGDRVWGKYGFTSSVNLKNDFVSPLYVGIELGPMIQLIENYRSGLIWDLFSNSRVMKNFVKRAGMSGVVDDFELPPEAPAYAMWSVEGGSASVSDDEPAHGRKCLSIRADQPAVRINGKLTENDLLGFYFGRYLSIWTRDLKVNGCAVVLDGREVSLAPAGSLVGEGWDHLYYRLPAHSRAGALCGVILDAEVQGRRPALDNLTLEAGVDLGAPEAVRDLQAATGKLGGSVDLRWTAARDTGKDRVAKYVLTATPADAAGPAKRIELPAARPPGETEERTVLLDSHRRYSLAVAAVDEHGHVGPLSSTVEVESNANALNPTASDFENGTADGWENGNPAWSLRVVDEGGKKCLQVDYDKNHAWNHVIANLDPDMVKLHRYVTLRVRGRVELLGKLWCRDGLEQDMEAHRSDSDTEWTLMKFDTRRATLINPARDPVQKLILFPQPGQWSGKGTFWLDDLAYSNE